MTTQGQDQAPTEAATRVVIATVDAAEEMLTSTEKEALSIMEQLRGTVHLAATRTVIHMEPAMETKAQQPT